MVAAESLVWTILSWNNGLLLDGSKPVTFCNQSECFISVLQCYIIWNLYMTLAPEIFKILQQLHHKKLDYRVRRRGSITVSLTSSLSALHSIALLHKHWQHIYLLACWLCIQLHCYININNIFTCWLVGRQSSQTGGQPYSETTPYEVRSNWKAIYPKQGSVTFWPMIFQPIGLNSRKINWH